MPQSDASFSASAGPTISEVCLSLLLLIQA
jgi:hypothetical protein